MDTHVNCPDHGLIPKDHRCGQSAADHICAYSAEPDYEPDQMTSWDDWCGAISWRMYLVVRLHEKRVDHGMTDGSCAECGLPWPCRTWHVAHGYEDYDCVDSGWCAHAAVKLDGGK